MDYFVLLFEWAVIFAINVIPAFAPPTWMALSYFYITSPQNIFLLVLIGVTASTCGRYILAKISAKTFDILGKKDKEDMEFLREKLKGKKWKKFIFSFLFSLGPFPSNALFITIGATKIKLREILAGFFFGRLLSYLFLVFTTQHIFSSLELTFEGQATLWTIVVEIIGVLAIIWFFTFDWKKFFKEKC
jgi:membrane protein YqaA with SNARE-associated domain